MTRRRAVVARRRSTASAEPKSPIRDRGGEDHPCRKLAIGPQDRRRTVYQARQDVREASEASNAGEQIPHQTQWSKSQNFHERSNHLGSPLRERRKARRKGGTAAQIRQCRRACRSVAVSTMERRVSNRNNRSGANAKIILTKKHRLGSPLGEWRKARLKSGKAARIMQRHRVRRSCADQRWNAGAQTQ